MGHFVNIDALPDFFPTHRHEGQFWESLGRVVATFGFLEEVLAKAIFSFSATRRYKEEEIEQAYEEWRSKLERALADPLGPLIDSYGAEVRDHQDATTINLDDLLQDLREVSKLRNVVCHGSWRMPDAAGASVPRFVNRRQEVFETPVNRQFLDQLQQSTTELACLVINTVTHMGHQFPGSTGPGKEI